MAKNANKPNQIKWLKITLISISSLIILAIVGIGSIILFVDPNTYKAKIIQAIENSTGAKLEVGKIHWGLNPGLSLITENVVFDTRAKLSNAPLVSLGKAECSIKILPLLHGNVVIDKLVFDSLKLNLVTNGKRNSWTLTGQDNPESGSSSQSNYQIQLSAFTLNNSSITYTNLQTHQIITIPTLNLDLENNDKGPISYLGNANILNMNEISYSLNNILTGKLTFNYSPDGYTANISATKFALNNLLGSLGLSKQKSFVATPWQNISFNLNMSVNNNSLKLNNSTVHLGYSAIAIDVDAQSLSPLQASNRVQIDGLTLSDFVPLSGYVVRLTSINLGGNISTDNSKNLSARQDLHVGNITLQGYNLHNLSVQVATILSDPIKIVSIPLTIDKIKSSLDAANSKGPKNLNLVSNLGSLDSTAMTYRNGLLTTPNILLTGPDLWANAKGSLNQNKNQLNYQINARFIAAPNTLTGKIDYPVTMVGAINNPTTSVNWNSVSSQITGNLGSAITNTGKSVGKATGSTLNKIGSTIKGWF